MAVLGDFFLNFLVKDIKSVSNAPSVGTDAISYDWRFSYQLSSSTNPPASQVWHDTMALAAGTLTFSLESLTRVNQTALDLTGLEVYWFIFYNPVGNASMNFMTALSNGYPVTGGTTEGQDVGAGGLVVIHERGGLGAVSTTLSDITVTGTGTQSFEALIVAGP